MSDPLKVESPAIESHPVQVLESNSEPLQELLIHFSLPGDRFQALHWRISKLLADLPLWAKNKQVLACERDHCTSCELKIN